MFENLFNLVKENAGDTIINNPAIPNEKNDEAISTTTNSIVNTLKGQVDGGNTNSLLEMFNNGDTKNSPVGNVVQQNVINDLMNKFGINNYQASSIANTLIPTVMDKFVSKTNDKNDSSFDLEGIVGSLGGKIDGIGGMIGKLFK